MTQTTCTRTAYSAVTTRLATRRDLPPPVPISLPLPDPYDQSQCNRTNPRRVRSLPRDATTRRESRCKQIAAPAPGAHGRAGTSGTLPMTSSEATLSRTEQADTFQCLLQRFELGGAEHPRLGLGGAEHPRPAFGSSWCVSPLVRFCPAGARRRRPICGTATELVLYRRSRHSALRACRVFSIRRVGLGGVSAVP